MPRLKFDPVKSVRSQCQQLESEVYQEGRILMLQIIPGHHGAIPDTTCGITECPETETIFCSLNYRLSSEKIKNCDPSKPLGFRAVAPLIQVRVSSRNPKYSKRGQGARGERWRCVRCVDATTKQMDTYKRSRNPLEVGVPYHVMRQFAEFIFAEQRTIPAYPGMFTLPSPHHFGLEKWKAAHRYFDRKLLGDRYKVDAPEHIKVPDELILGTDGESLYLDDKTRNMRGLTVRGKVAEITARECIGMRLTDVMLRVNKIVDKLSKAEREARLFAETLDNHRRKAQLYEATLGVLGNPSMPEFVEHHQSRTAEPKIERAVKKLKTQPKPTSSLVRQNRHVGYRRNEHESTRKDELYDTLSPW